MLQQPLQTLSGGQRRRIELALHGAVDAHEFTLNYQPVVEADSGWVAVCFQAPVVETYNREAAEPDADQ